MQPKNKMETEDSQVICLTINNQYTVKILFSKLKLFFTEVCRLELMSVYFWLTFGLV